MGTKFPGAPTQPSSLEDVIRTLRLIQTSSAIVMPSAETLPTEGVEGQIVLCATDHHFYGWSNGAWKQLDN